MDYKVLKEKFFMGTTTREEEDVLRRYLMGDNLSAEAKEDKEMMLAMLQPAEYDCTEAMEEVTAMIDNLAAQESVAAGEKSAQRSVVLRYLAPAFAAAAVLALLFVVVPYPDDAIGVQGSTDNKQYVAANEQPKTAEKIVTIVLEEPQAVTVSEPDESTNDENLPAPVDGSMLADAGEAVAAQPGEEAGPIVPNSGNAGADAALLVALTGNGGTKAVAPEATLEGEYAGSHSSGISEHVVGSDNSFTLSEPPLIAMTDEGDTFSNPQDAIEHLDVLLAIFSQAASGGVEEQKMHLKQFVVMNSGH